MASEILWVVHVRAKREANARRVLRRVVAVIGQPAEERSIERYWKIPEQYVAVLATPLEVPTAPEAVFQTMLSAQEIGSGWLVVGPHSSDGRNWTFEMICAANANGRFRVPGVEWVHVQLEMYDEPAVDQPQPSQSKMTTHRGWIVVDANAALSSAVDHNATA